MTSLILYTLIISGITNMIADILMVSGKKSNKKQTILEWVEKTPLKHLVLSGIIGLISISSWMSPIYYLANIPTVAGTVALLSFAVYIASLTTFHVMCTYSIICYKFNKETVDLVTKGIKMYGSVCILFSCIYTGTMIYLSLTGILEMNVLQYLTLPIFSMIIIQFALGKALSKIPHFTSVAGTIGMVVSLLGTVSIMIQNQIR